MPAAALVFILSLHREVGDRPQNSAGCERGNDEPKENIRRQFVHEIDDADRNEITEDEEYDIIDFPNFHADHLNICHGLYHRSVVLYTGSDSE